MAALGIEHVGMTVPDIDPATTFFEQAFGAELVYDGLKRTDAPLGGSEMSRRCRVIVDEVRFAHEPRGSSQGDLRRSCRQLTGSGVARKRTGPLRGKPGA